MSKSLCLVGIGVALAFLTLGGTAVVGTASAQIVEMTIEPGETGWRSVQQNRPVDAATSTPILVRLRRMDAAPWLVNPGELIPGAENPDTRPLIVVRVLTPKRSYQTRAYFDKSRNPSEGFLFNLDNLEDGITVKIDVAIVKPERGLDPVKDCRCRYFFLQDYAVSQSGSSLGDEPLPVFSFSPERKLTKVFTPGFEGERVDCPRGVGRFVTVECRGVPSDP